MMNPSVHPDDARFLQLLEQWLQGDFTRSDEQQLRALLENDDFRREAWEGFAVLPEVNHHIQLEALRRRLLGRRPAKRVPVALWSAIAAVFLLLVAAVYFFTPAGRDNSAPAAQTEAAPLETPDSTPNLVAASPEDAPPAALEPAGESAKRIPSGAVSRQPFSSGPADGLAGSADAPYASGAARPTSPAQTGHAADSTVSPGGPANYQQMPATAPVNSGPAGNYVSKPTPPAPPKTAMPKSVIDEEATPATERKDAVPADKKMSAQDDAQPAMPVGGWDDFYRYLRKNARLPDAARNNNISGYVRLSFTVGADGKPADVKILQALGYGCEAEAQRLIGQFQWAPPGNQPVTVQIPFVR